jgi:hypothetical protein
MAFPIPTIGHSVLPMLPSSVLAKSAGFRNEQDKPLCPCNKSSTTPKMHSARLPNQVGSHAIRLSSDPMVTSFLLPHKNNAM